MEDINVVAGSRKKITQLFGASGNEGIRKSQQIQSENSHPNVPFQPESGNLLQSIYIYFFQV